ncbi:unnamed protein product [Albugo candida]|uniref:TATA-binding protein interacting (TIP20) domain-containing protein n=1 Tax=Albugo candida TaxID=65357 RepID=A0A024GMA5_9STRA|nr:unnamed protein product [Albugo candida]|eukprot:CCI47457.1 unnamed protein product [Albugo candida]
MANPNYKSISAQFLQSLSRSDLDTRIKADVLDSLTDVLRRFGNCIGSDHETYQNLFLTHLHDPSYLIRKRTIQCVGSLDEKIVPLLIQFCGRVDDTTMQNGFFDELRENCIQAFESRKLPRGTSTPSSSSFIKIKNLQGEPPCLIFKASREARRMQEATHGSDNGDG